MTTDILREAEADLAELAGLPGAIRDKVKAGVAELKRLRDAVDTEITRLTGGAKATLESLQALAPAPTGPEGGSTDPLAVDPPPPAEDGRPVPAV